MNHQEVVKRKISERMVKTVDKYAVLKFFYCDLRLHVYMYALMCVHPNKIPV